MNNASKAGLLGALAAGGLALSQLYQSPQPDPLPPYLLALEQVDEGCLLSERHLGIVTASHAADCALAGDAGLPQVWDLSEGPWDCACAAGPGCEALLSNITADGTRGPDYWGPAPAAQYLPAGRWRGADCAPTPCIEVAGSPALNPRCR